MTKRRRYAKELRIEAIELAERIGSTAQAEHDLGVPIGEICKWRAKFEKDRDLKKAFRRRGNVRDDDMKALK